MKKNWLVALIKTTMKIAIVQTFVALTFTCMAMADYAEAQEMDQEISISVEEMKIRSVLGKIQKETKIKFVYSPSIIPVNEKISVDFSNEKLGDALSEILKPYEVNYKVMNNRILLYKENRDFSSIDNNVQHGSNAERWIAKVVSGIVKSTSGEPLPGVSIVIEGTTVGTITDINGNFKLNIPTEHTNGVLLFSFVGYKTKEIPITNQTELDVTLEEDITALEEIVVVGFGEQRKVSLVGAQSTVKVKDIKTSAANLSTVLAGRVSGVVAVQRSGKPGYDNADIWIRGISTFSSSSRAPLVLVDGVARSLNNIDPQDVESFTILKDASATAVYGVRGANGVIIVKTKGGEKGKPRVNFDYNQGVTTFTQVPELVDGPTYMKLANEALTTRGQAARFSDEAIEKTISGEDPYLYPNVNWMDEVFNKWGNNKRANLNVSGGSENARYYVSLGYYDETGFFVTDDLSQYNSEIKFSRYNITTNLNLDVTSTTNVELGIQGYLSDGNYPGVSDGDIFTSAMQVPPVEYPVMYPGGYVPGRNPNGDFRNPYGDATQRGYETDSRNQLYSNVRVTQKLDKITEGLSVTGMFAFDAYNEHKINRSKRVDTYIVDPNDPRNLDGTLNLLLTYTGQNYLGYSRENGGNRSIYIESSVNYNRTFEKHRVSGLLLYNQTDKSNAFAGDFTSSIPERNRGLAGRGTYSYDDRYFLEVNVGYNGSENFAPSKRYGLFPALGFGWVLSNEQFFEPLTDVIQFFKIRYTDGLVGSGAGGRRFGYLTFLNDGGDNAPGYTFGTNRRGYSGINVQDYAVDVTWAEARKQDLGIEINTFRDRLSLIVDIFKERREGIFLQRGAVPNFVGLTNDPWGNLGIVENKGIDGTMQFQTEIGKVLFQVQGNFTYTRDKVIENDQPEQLYEWQERRGTNLLARYGYVAEGLFASQDEIDNSATQFGTVLPGDIKYKDLNEDGVIDAFDQTKIGRGDVPSLLYGFSLGASYKGFDVSAFFQGQSDADVLLGGYGIMPFNGDGGTGNLHTVALDRWTEENPDPNAFYPRLAYGSAMNNNNTQPSSWWVKDVDFIRLKTAEIGYTLPENITSRVGIRTMRFYLRGFNLLTFTNFKLWDPELTLPVNDYVSYSNGARYPNISIYSLGVNIQF